MKYLTVLCFCLIVSFSIKLKAQIPNAGFEDWDSSGEPTGWFTNNAPGVFTTITKSNDAYSGSWAVEGNVVSVSGLTVGPTIIGGEEGAGIPINFRPASLRGYYKFNPVNNDYMQVQAYFFKNGVGRGAGAANLSPIGTYTQFSVNINYIDNAVPDTVLISIFISGQAGFASVGSKMFVDDLSFSNTTDVSDLGNGLPDEYDLMQNYPNPFNPSTIISWQTPVSGWQTLKVYNAIGKEVATLVNEYREAGKHSVGFDASSVAGGISSGVYFYQLQFENVVETKKMILIQ